MIKKSFYIFLTSLLGVLLFLILHRIFVFIYLFLVANYFLLTDFNYLQFLAWDYFTLVIVLMLGAWYGVWLGLYWYKLVYEDASHGGLVSHISKRIFTKKPKNLTSKMLAVKEKLEKDLWELEDLTQVSQTPSVYVEPVKRKVVRKRAPKKLNS